MTDAAQVEEALKHFPCGPGGHSPNAGMLLGGFGADVGWIRFCEACGKRDGPMTCLFCEAPAGRSGSHPPFQYTVAGPDGRPAAGGLCRDCLSGIRATGATGWTIVHG